MDPHSQTCPARSQYIHLPRRAPLHAPGLTVTDRYNLRGRGMFLFYGWASMVCSTISLMISPVMALST